MKKIIALTDLSSQSRSAAEAAVMFGGRLHANLILFNTFVSQPVLPEYGGSPWSVEELIWADEGKGKLHFLKEQLQPQIEALPAGDHHPGIDCRQGMGNLGPQVKELVYKETTEMVVMGARTGSTWDHILMGSDTVSVINHVDRPVLVIPEASPLKQLKKVTLATDLDDADINAVHYITKLGRFFDFEIEIVNVRLWGAEGVADTQREAFEKRVAKFNYPHISYRHISGKDLINRINQFCKQNATDLLVLVHDKHSLLSRLFNGTHAKSLLEKQECPVMIIPAGIVV